MPRTRSSPDSVTGAGGLSVDGLSSALGGAGQSIRDTRTRAFPILTTSHTSANRYAFTRLDDTDPDAFAELTGADDVGDGEGVAAFELNLRDDVPGDGSVRATAWVLPEGRGVGFIYVPTTGGGTGGTPCAGCGWVAGLVTTDCLEATLLSAAGRCFCATSSGSPIPLKYVAGKWRSRSGQMLTVCGQDYTLSFDRAGCDGPCLTLVPVEGSGSGSGSGSGGGDEDEGVCDCEACPDGAAESYTATLSGGTGEYASLSGAVTVTRAPGSDHDGYCYWSGTLAGWSVNAIRGPGGFWLLQADDGGGNFANYNGDVGGEAADCCTPATFFAEESSGEDPPDPPTLTPGGGCGPCAEGGRESVGAGSGDSGSGSGGTSATSHVGVRDCCGPNYAVFCFGAPGLCSGTSASGGPAANVLRVKVAWETCPPAGTVTVPCCPDPVAACVRVTIARRDGATDAATGTRVLVHGSDPGAPTVWRWRSGGELWGLGGTDSWRFVRSVDGYAFPFGGFTGDEVRLRGRHVLRRGRPELGAVHRRHRAGRLRRRVHPRMGRGRVVLRPRHRRHLLQRRASRLRQHRPVDHDLQRPVRERGRGRRCVQLGRGRRGRRVLPRRDLRQHRERGEDQRERRLHWTHRLQPVEGRRGEV